MSLVLAYDVNAKGTYRDPRIKQLHRDVIALANKRKLKVVKIPATELRRLLLGNATGTKHEMAEMMAKRFPDELAQRLPPKRKPWESEDTPYGHFLTLPLYGYSIFPEKMKSQRCSVRSKHRS